MCVNNLYVNLVIFILCLVFADAQKCGTVSPDGKEVPWEAGIYSKESTDGRAVKRELLCGGSLISSKVVLTATSRIAWIYNPRSIEVVVGKLYLHFFTRQTDIIQKSDVESIHTAPGFKELSKYPYFVDDIAIVIVVNSFISNKNIRPVCLDFDYNFEKQQLTDGNVGKTTLNGYVVPSTMAAYEYAQKLTLVSLDVCVSNKTIDDSLNMTTISDKICMDDKERFSTMCRTEIGVGISFPATSKGVEQYYVRGVYSQSIEKEAHCSSETHYAYTLLRKHEDFIRKYWNETEEAQKTKGKCLLPPYPDHGSYSVNVTNVPGSEEFLLMVLTITCESGYGVLGNKDVNCYNGFWPDTMPTCVRMCRLDLHPSVDYRCIVSGSVVGERTCDINEPVGTIVNPRCRDPDYYSPTNLPFMRCTNDAQWDYVARCLPECGLVTPDGKELVSDGVRAKKGELPWHAGIYRTTAQPYIQICGGSLISKNLILSAAHCFWNSTTKLQHPSSRFAVAVGKIYRPWDNTMDEAQKSDVKEIHIPSRYQGIDANFQEDIAVLVVATPFELKRFVRPVCLSFDPNFDRLQLQTSNKGKVNFGVECGRLTPDGKELVFGGVRAKKGELPWHAGIYRTTAQPYIQICGGSLISKKLVVSAAHCFWNSTTKLLHPSSRFAVAVGKIYRPWDDPMDEAQKSDVKEIHIPSRYQGVDASFQDDIAVLVVTTPFELKRFVRPVCLSFDPNFDRLQLQTSNKGKVAGWGLTGPNGKASPVLQVIQLPYVEIGTCIKESPHDFSAFLTSDKICAGTQHSNSALCKGDSGGGLAFPAIERDVERHYLRGVVSTAPSNNDLCNTDTYTSFTQIIKHQDFIQPFLTLL